MKRFLVFMGCLVLLVGNAGIASASITSQALVAEGRTLLFNNGIQSYAGILAARDKFQSALTDDPTDDAAHAFHAATSLMAFALEEGGGAEAQTLRDLAGAFGIPFDATIDNPAFGLPYSEPPDIYGSPYIPETAPDGKGVEQFMVGPLMGLIDDAISHLSQISSGFNTILTTSETGSTPVEIDYGDILLARAVLKGAKCFLSITTAYNFEIDLRDVLFAAFNENLLQLQRDIIDKYPNFLRLNGVNGAEGKAALATAKTALMAAFEDYYFALDFIFDETDDQIDDFFYFEIPEDYADAQLIPYYFSEIESSLVENRPAVFTETTDVWRLENGTGGWLEFEVDALLDGRYEGDEIHGDGALLFSWGWVEDFHIDGTNISILLESGIWCPAQNNHIYPQYTLQGTLSGDQILNGTYSYIGCDQQVITGGFTGTRITETEEIRIDFNALFGNSGTISPAKPALDIRSAMPEFDRFNGILPGTFPGAPVLNGIIPDLISNDDLIRAFELQPGGDFPIPVISNGGIVIDGAVSDWPAGTLVFSDMTEDEDEDADFPGADIQDLRLAKDAEYLYVAMTLADGNPNPVSGMNYVFRASSDWEEDDDYEDRFTAATFDGTSWIPGVFEGNQWGFSTINQYPSFQAAAGNQAIEWKVPLADVGDLAGKFIRVFSYNNNPPYEISDDNSTRMQMDTATAAVTVNFNQFAYSAGNIYIGAFAGPSPDSPSLGGAYLSGPGTAEISGLPVGSTVYFFARCDTDDNGVKTFGDYWGNTGPYTIQPGGNPVPLEMEFVINDSYPLTKPGLYRVFGSTDSHFSLPQFAPVSDNPNEMSWGTNWVLLGESNQTQTLNAGQFYKYLMIIWHDDFPFSLDAVEDLTAQTAIGLNADGTSANFDYAASDYIYDEDIIGRADGKFYESRNNYGYLILAMPADSVSTAAPRQLKITLIPKAANDNFADAFPITGSVDQAAGHNAGATGETGEPDHAGYSDGQSVWWRWTAPSSGTVVMDTFGSSFDTLLAVYTGNSVDNLNCIRSNDDSGNAQSRVIFSATGGMNYQIAVDGYHGSYGQIVLNWTLISPEPQKDILPGGIPDTGQSKCFDNLGEISCPQSGEAFHGQDAHYVGPRSYTKLDAQGKVLPYDTANWSMVRDNVTGLIWEIKGNPDGNTDYNNPNDADNIYTWFNQDSGTNGGSAGTPGDGTDTTDFIATLNAMHYGGHNDWRIPTINELTSLAHLGRWPTVDLAFFPETMASYWAYWSSTPHANNTENAWVLGFNSGDIFNLYKSNQCYVRAVRGGQNGAPEFENNGDGTVTDVRTGLMWKQATDASSTWQAAISHCENLEFAGYDDWRLPDRNELQTLIDFEKLSPFPDTESSSPYWTATTQTNNTNQAFTVDFFYDGWTFGNPKENSNSIRAVRGGQSGSLPYWTIKSPARASRWAIGETVPLSWDTSLFTGDVTISISRDGGKTFEMLATVNNSGIYEWRIVGAESVNCMLKITEAADPSKTALRGLFTIGAEEMISGDINNDKVLDLEDAILALKIAVGVNTGISIPLENDVNGDGKIGLPEASYILEVLTGMRD